MKNHEFIAHLQTLLGDTAIIDVTRIHGGHISRAYRLKTTNASFFIKVNAAEHFPDMFASEAAGLSLLADSHTVSIPKLVAQGEWNDYTYLLMEWVDTIDPPLPGTMELFGRQLADMHRHSSLFYGLSWDHKAWLLQSNKPHEDWAEFFITRRLQPTLASALEKGHLTPADARKFETLYQRIPSLFPKEPPALLHGDCWKGNFLAGADGHPYLVDPVAYYGHREMDIAMSCMFGGFDESFYAAYYESFPLVPGWKERIDLCNLYPLLILTVFGPDYKDRLQAALAKYG
ncbi:MAG TPA: fructosamine kinase family protein [Puia sp.]|jgi:hypothetical protein